MSDVGTRICGGGHSPWWNYEVFQGDPDLGRSLISGPQRATKREAIADLAKLAVYLERQAIALSAEEARQQSLAQSQAQLKLSPEW